MPLDPIWQQCLSRLERQFPLDEVNTWLRPLRLINQANGKAVLLAPNQIVCEHVELHYLRTIHAILQQLQPDLDYKPIVSIANRQDKSTTKANKSNQQPEQLTGLDQRYTFENFVPGKSNELALNAAIQVAGNPGSNYNPLTLYGSTGLGKTHLLHAAGNLIKQNNPQAKILYLPSERFVNDLVRSLGARNVEQFKQRYRSVDALLIDDIQFIAGKERSQEEFFHTFNALLDLQQQIILTCDRYPKEVPNLEPRLQSRFGWGLTVSIEPPDFETRVAILIQKAQEKNWDLPLDVAQLIAGKMRSSVRDLEGALNTLYANANFMGYEVNESFARDTLRDLLAIHDRSITLDLIKKTVAEFYNLREMDMLSKRRTRSIARPRQMAMALCKELTDNSLPEIGQAFGGRDHTTVLHACRKIDELVRKDTQLGEDKKRLVRQLST